MELNIYVLSGVFAVLVIFYVMRRRARVADQDAD
jgi:hypothetical protein